MLSVPVLFSVGTNAIARLRTKITLYWPSNGTTVRNLRGERNAFVPGVFMVPVTNTITEQYLLWIVGEPTSQHVRYLMNDKFSVLFKKMIKFRLRFLCNALTSKQTSKSKGHLV